VLLKVELVDYSDKLKFKKLREEKKEKAAEEVGKKKIAPKGVPPVERDLNTEGKKLAEEEINTEGKKKIESAKIKAGAEVMKQIEKSAAKELKQSVGGKKKQKTQPVRKALAK